MREAALLPRHADACVALELTRVGTSRRLGLQGLIRGVEQRGRR